ncbi:hypothetical protein [Sporosarcina koreensis]|uniref:hypothetical protein n=1 Tax=Sporosarcina koreensis TaxID=334735 RepID=UPI0005917A62|nr:hypothetical protein [Sporosarcina koreensis]
MNARFSAVLLSAVLLLSGCAFWDGIRGCPDGEIEWADVLKLEDIRYASAWHGPDDAMTVAPGKELGTVRYMLADHACSNHKLRNGDCAFLPVGTEVFEAQGYKPEFRVMADGRLFEATDSPDAETLGDFIDIDGKVTRILFLDQDERLRGELMEKEAAAFTEEYLQLSYEHDKDIADETTWDHALFVEFHLQDGTTYRTIYWMDENILGNDAYGTPAVKAIVERAVGE